jgi:hypothetical protein
MISTRASVARCLLFVAVCCGCSSAASHEASNGNGGAGAALATPTGTVACTSETGVDTYAAGLMKPGENGLFDFELVSSSPAPPALNDNTFVVRVTGPDGTPLDGTLSATLFMPEHGHSSPDVPVVTFDASTSAFTLDPMNLFMVGLWRITFTFEPSVAALAGAAGESDGADASDTAVYEFCVD